MVKPLVENNINMRNWQGTVQIKEYKCVLRIRVTLINVRIGYGWIGSAPIFAIWIYYGSKMSLWSILTLGEAGNLLETSLI